MKLIVPSRIYEYHHGGVFSSSAMVEYVRSIGFGGIDMSFDGLSRHDDAWRAVMYSVSKRAQDNSLTLPLCHLPFYMPDPNDACLMEKFASELRCGIDAAALMGIPYAVTHPICLRSDRYGLEEFLRRNIAFLMPICEYARCHGVTICIENMASHIEGAVLHMYGSMADEIAALAYALDARVCWDTGHANVTGIESQSKGIEKLGELLCALHASDNDGKVDSHLIPFEGAVDWEDVCRGLSRVGFKGDICLEVRSYDVPSDAVSRELFGKNTLLAGRKLLSMIK